MRVYTAHRRDAGLFEPPDLVLVKEGFCWPAFLFGFLWALWHRMWLTALLLFLAEALLAVVAAALGLATMAQIALSAGFMLFVGFGANDWRRRSLRRRGFEEGPVLVAEGPDAAAWRLMQAEAGAG